LLNWGYSPPAVEPNPGEAFWRSELEFARANGFNLMKFCLWVPPKRYLELADEMGMLTWMEYPTWHPDFSERFLGPLRREFAEFFQYDRNHPSVILRSLTCETGQSADLRVIQSLYDTAHAMIPGALVEDDSSWIGWNRVHDFYDDHPYGNNHTWVETLTGFKEHILAHGLKPLVLGEAIAADTWPDRPALLARLGSDRPWWAPGSLDETGRWLERMRQIAGDDGLDQLYAESLHYGLLMRKYQCEAFRRELPYAGYVISVIRDIPNATMGLIDYLGRPKWRIEDWGWHRETVCLLKTEEDRRSFAGGEPLRADVLLSHFGLKSIEEGLLTVRLVRSESVGEPVFVREVKVPKQRPATLAKLANLDWVLPPVNAPQRMEIQALLASSQGTFSNAWPVWVVPATSTKDLRRVELHPSVAPAMAAELLGGTAPSDSDAAAPQPAPGRLMVASRFDDELVRFIEAGGRVLFLPDGKEHSLPLNAHWFLRGAPYVPRHPLSARIPREFWVELQHFDLAAEVVPNVPLLEAWAPILYLWDTHDLQTVRTHGILFETRIGSGRLLVSAARLTGRNNPAGQWLLGVLVEHLLRSDPPTHALPDEAWAYLKEKLHVDQTNLTSRTWQFRPDPGNQGLAEGWHRNDAPAPAEWKEIRIGAWWESQGYGSVDGWAWYRLEVDIPAAWQSRDVYLSFEGVDDIYELYVNGKLAGQGGDLPSRKDALTERKSHLITRFVRPGSKAIIAVRVHDWFGAGGIFRPVTLGTLPLNPRLDLLR
jgi:hypothetical protein